MSTLSRDGLAVFREQAMAALAPQFLEMAESKTLVEQAMAALAPQFQEVQKLVDQLDWDAVLASP
ncbi:MAG: hypothetical protein QOE48_741 [Mycobacterium sp.]|jgi:hypothetical protein|nr:hypothetical protein [Mycobacterium sp.]MDT5305073.1 hypothetical protein [Mycobacterium sp.]MDT5322012.1 hypothetical protein [Mycobacterium sp.]